MLSRLTVVLILTPTHSFSVLHPLAPTPIFAAHQLSQSSSFLSHFPLGKGPFWAPSSADESTCKGSRMRCRRVQLQMIGKKLKNKPPPETVLQRLGRKTAGILNFFPNILTKLRPKIKATM